MLNNVAIAERCKIIENGFKELKILVTKSINSAEVENTLRKMEKALHDLFKKDFTISIIRPDPNTQFSVMSVYPDESSVTKIVEVVGAQKHDGAIVKALWEKCEKWTIEIDIRCFTSKTNLSTKELTALLMHEVGHVVSSDSVPSRINKILQFKVAEADIATKAILKDPIFKKIITLPILDTCTFNTKKSRDGIREEMRADHLAVRYGYKDDLSSALNKFISTNGTTKDESMGNVSDFMLSTIDNFKERRARINRNNLRNLLNNVASERIRKEIQSFGESTVFFESGNGSLTFTSERVLFEKICDHACKIADSTYTKEFSLFKKKLKRIEPYELDYIAIEKDKMKTNDDKLLLVSYIHSKLDIVNYYISILDNPIYAEKFIVPHSKEELVNIRERLLNLRVEVLNKPIVPIKYGLTIAYPSGYEG